MVGRRPQHAVSKLPCLVMSSARSCRSSICPGRLSAAWLVSLVVFSCHNGVQVVTRVHRSYLRRLICPAQDHFIFLTVLIIITFPLATYGCETWVLRKLDIKRINAFEMKCYRNILRIPWIAHRTNCSILNELHPPTNWLYHFVKKNPNIYPPGLIVFNTSSLFFRLEYLQYSAIYPHMKGIKSGQQ